MGTYAVRNVNEYLMALHNSFIENVLDSDLFTLEQKVNALDIEPTYLDNKNEYVDEGVVRDAINNTSDKIKNFTVNSISSVDKALLEKAPVFIQNIYKGIKKFVRISGDIGRELAYNPKPVLVTKSGFKEKQVKVEKLQETVNSLMKSIETSENRIMLYIKMTKNTKYRTMADTYLNVIEEERKQLSKKYSAFLNATKTLNEEINVYNANNLIDILDYIFAKIRYYIKLVIIRGSFLALAANVYIPSVTKLLGITDVSSGFTLAGYNIITNAPYFSVLGELLVFIGKTIATAKAAIISAVGGPTVASALLMAISFIGVLIIIGAVLNKLDSINSTKLDFEKYKKMIELNGSNLYRPYKKELDKAIEMYKFRRKVLMRRVKPEEIQAMPVDKIDAIKVGV
jgi:hypothetical protein